MDSSPGDRFGSGTGTALSRAIAQREGQGAPPGCGFGVGLDSDGGGCAGFGSSDLLFFVFFRPRLRTPARFPPAGGSGHRAGLLHWLDCVRGRCGGDLGLGRFVGIGGGCRRRWRDRPGQSQNGAGSCWLQFGFNGRRLRRRLGSDRLRRTLLGGSRRNSPHSSGSSAAFTSSST